MVAQIRVCLTCCCVCMQTKLLLAPSHQTSILDHAFPKPSPRHDSGRTKCLKYYKFLESTKCALSGNSELLPANRHVRVPAGEKNSSQGGSFVPSTIQGYNSTSPSSLNNSRAADITERVTSTPSAALQWSIHMPITTPDTSSHSTPAPGGTLQTDSMHLIVSSPVSGIASTPTSLSGLANLPTPIPNPEA